MAKINKPSIATDTSLLVVGHNRGVGFSEKVNYNSETREQVIKLVLKGEKSAIDTELVKRALSNAIMQRGHHDRLTFHSDRGVQYSSMGYRTMLSENGIIVQRGVPTTTPAWKASSQASRRRWPTGGTSRTSKMCGRPFSGTSSCSTTGNGSIVCWDT